MAGDASTNRTIDDVLISEDDNFRLAIRGFAVIEDSIAAGIAEAFEGPMPSELKRLPFRARLALFLAVTSFPEESVKPLIALAKLRNDFAHGRLNDLTRQRANSLADEFRKVFPKTAESIFKTAETPHSVLGRCLFMGDVIVDAGTTRVKQRRDEERKAIKLQEDLKQRLLDEG